MCKIVHSWVGILRTTTRRSQALNVQHFTFPGQPLDNRCAMLHTCHRD